MKKITGIIYISLFSVVSVADILPADPLERCRKEMSSYGAAERCAREVVEVADKELNVAYKTLMSQLKDHDAKKLRNAQRKWIDFKEADCEFSSPLSAEPDIKELSDRAYCVAEKTLIRLKEINKIISWPVGCGGCPF